MTLKPPAVVILVILFLSLLFGLGIVYDLWQKDKANYKGLIALNESKYHDTVTYMKARDGELIETNNAINITVQNLEDANDELTKELDNMKIKPSKVISADYSQEKTTDNIIVKYVTPKDTSTNKPFVFKPFQVKDSNKYHYVTGTVYDTALKLRYINYDSTYFITYTSGGFFQKKVVKASVLHSNPSIITTNMQVFTIKPELKFYERGLFKFGLGLVAGVYIESKILK